MKANTLTTTRKASFWQRLIAMVIDIVLLLILIWLAKMIFELSDASVYWIYVVLFYVYNIFMDTLLQQTVGKMILKIRVVKTDGTKPGLVSSFYRNFGKIISALPLWYGFLRILAPHQRQTMHDEIAKCLVVA